MFAPATERRFLQATIAIAGCVPVFAGLAGMVLGGQMLGETLSISLDSHLRYLSGLLFAIGICFWWMIPTIERRTTLVRVLTAIVFVGGITRLLAAFAIGSPSDSMIFAIVMEVVTTPLICLWQTRISRF